LGRTLKELIREKV